jgi:hypothetical protein
MSSGFHGLTTSGGNGGNGSRGGNVAIGSRSKIGSQNRIYSFMKSRGQGYQYEQYLINALGLKF